MKHLNSELLAHKNNLEQKRRRAEALSLEERGLVSMAVAAYEGYIRKIHAGEIAQCSLTNAVAALNEYLDVAKTLEAEHGLFNWRSDFASSVIPEFLYITIHTFLNGEGMTPFFSTKNSIVEVVLTSSAERTFEVRKKDQDFCMGFSKASFQTGPATETFILPALVFEVKTNIDINKLNGLKFSAERLKRSFPHAKYFLVSETIDFSLKDNYAAGSLDEVYVLRKQMRSASRRAKGPLQADVFEEILRDVLEIAKRSVAERGHVYSRLKSGKLINAK